MDLITIIRYLIILIYSVIAFIVIISGILWLIFDQNRNAKRKSAAGLFLSLGILSFYILRFGSLFVLSILNSNGNNITGINDLSISNFLRLLQLAIISFVPTFTIIQSYIFKYKFLITKDPDSKVANSKWLVRTISMTFAGLVVLQLLILLF